MAADNSAYDYFLQNNPHKPENNKPVSNAEKKNTCRRTGNSTCT